MNSSASCGDDDDGANIDLGASLLLPGKYTKIWRRYYYIGILISLKKSTTSNGTSECPPPPPSPYVSLPQPEPSAGTSSPKPHLAINIPSLSIEIIQRIMKENDLNLLGEFGGVQRVCSFLRQQSKHSEEGNIDVKPYITVHGTSFSRFLLISCKRNMFTIVMLLFSTVVSFAVEFKQEGPRYGWHDGTAIGIALVLLVLFPSITNFFLERKMMKLSERKAKLKFNVERGETDSLLVSMSDMLVGDIVSLSKDNEVPADGLFLDGENLVLDGAVSEIDHERNPFLIAGTKVIQGHGKMVVTPVGDKRMQNSMSCNPKRGGLLDDRIEKPISCIDKFSLCVFALVGVVVLIRLFCKKDGDSGGLPDLKGKVSVGVVMKALERTILRPQGRILVLTGLVTAAILCIQHGMPLAVAISFGCLIEKEESNPDVVLNDLSSCTTMGLVTVICIDVSGGLIYKPMEVSRIYMGEKDISMIDGSEVNQVVLEKLQQGIALSGLAPELPLSPMSISLNSWAETTWGMNIKSFTKEFEILEHRKSDREGSGVLVSKVGDNKQDLHLHWSGAASAVLDKCSQYYNSNGECYEMIEDQKSKFGKVIKEMKESGLEPIAFAHKKAEVQELEQHKLILIGVIGLKKPCQESTKKALEYLRSVGINIKLVSEDDIMAVKAIASELGIELPQDGDVLEGKELQDLNSNLRLGKVDLPLMGSFSPEHMILMVKCLQEKGHVVAFVGRKMKTTHASILQIADVGIVLDSGGRIENTKSFGINIKCLGALEQVVRAGRSNYNNIQKFIQIQIIFGISGSLITLITTIFTGESPLTGFQLIWVNVLLCLLGGLMMVMEFNGDGQPLPILSSNRNPSIITGESLKSIVIQVSYQISASMILEFGGHITDREKVVRKTMIFNTFMLCQVFNLLNTMHVLKREVLQIVLRSYYFLMALALCFLMQLLVIEYANSLANCIRLNAHHWAICVLVGIFSCIFEWLLKTLIVNLSTNYASGSNNSPSGSSNRSHLIYLSWGFPFLMLFFSPLVFGQMRQIFP